MSASGHERTLRRVAGMSALHLKAQDRRKIRLEKFRSFFEKNREP
jgi:hypothetical protein